jgi:hypothetical protein
MISCIVDGNILYEINIRYRNYCKFQNFWHFAFAGKLLKVNVCIKGEFCYKGYERSPKVLGPSVDLSMV